METLANIAALHGHTGILTYLREHRQSHRELLQELASPALLGTAVGLQIELLPIRLQREVWGAFVKWHGILPVDALRELVTCFLNGAHKPSRLHAPADAMCLYLAEVLLDTVAQSHDDEDEGSEFFLEERHASTNSEDICEPDPVGIKLQRLVFLPTMPVAISPPTTNVAVSTAAPTDGIMSRKRRRSLEIETETEHDQLDSKPGIEGLSTVPVVTLPPDMETRVTALAQQLVLLGVPDVSTDMVSRASELVTLTVDLLRQVMNHVHATQQANETLFEMACYKLQLSVTSDDALFQITSALMDANWSSRYAAIFLDTTLLPRIFQATSVISRVLLQTVLLYGKPSYATALLDGLLVPLLTASTIGPSQGEAVTRMLRDKCIETGQLDLLLTRVLTHKNESLLTNEATMLVFQNVLNMKPVLAATTIELLVSAARNALDHEPTNASLKKSSKFATLLFTLVSKFGSQCRSHAEELEGVASQLTSSMAKSTVRAIQKLES